MSRFNSPVRIRFHHRRYRLGDIDGYSIKAAIDGIVQAKILEDDSPTYVQEVAQTHEKITKDIPEETIITIEEI